MKRVKQLYLFKEVESHMRITDKIHVRSHQRRDGSYVREYWRRRPTRKGSSRKLSPKDEQMSFLKGSREKVST